MIIFIELNLIVEKLRILRILPVIALIIFSGCKKDDPLTPVQLLSGTNSNGKSWQLIDQTLDGTSTAVGTCNADDITTFFPSLDYTFEEGASKCDSGDPQTLSGTWVLDQNDTHLLITIGTDVIDYEVVSLTESTLSLKTIFLELEVITVFRPQ